MTYSIWTETVFKTDQSAVEGFELRHEKACKHLARFDEEALS